MLNRVTMLGESGGDPNAVSSAGARGTMQVMPSTARDPGFGIQPSNGTPADDARVGQEYRAKMQQRYNGDLRKMWAAYNWGPGNLDRAIAQHGDNWMQAAPAETRNYIAGNLRRMGARDTGYDVVTNADRSQWDKRADGSTKGTGWLGLLRRPDGNVSSEISAGVTVNGKEMDVPLMVPGLTKPELDYLMTHEPDLEKNPRFFRDMPRSILAKAEAFAQQRLAQGKSPFRQDGE